MPKPVKFKLYIEYNGTKYSGWQKQRNARTIQGILESTIKKVFLECRGSNTFIDMQGAGRTDKGVHALEQVAHLECITMLAPEILKMKINDKLPSNINILEIEKADKKFHARHSATSRQYLYRISRRRTAFEKKFVWWVKESLDINLIKKSAELFKGFHDFQSFCDKSEEEEVSTKVNVEDIKIEEDRHIILIRIKASHFLWKMVRRIVGILVEAGKKNITNRDIEMLLNRYSTRPLKYTAPPSGLFLEKVYY